MAMRVYRFRDKVALNPPEGDTFYLSPAQATEFLNAIKRVTDEFEAGVRFADSKVGTTEIEASGSRYSEE